MPSNTAYEIYVDAKLKAGIHKIGGIHALRHYADFRIMPSPIALL